MSECSHNCGTCGENCSSRTQDKKSFLEALAPESSVKKVIGVVSGKGGVGKSLVTSMMAVSMSRKGKHAAILDADITRLFLWHLALPMKKQVFPKTEN